MADPQSAHLQLEGLRHRALDAAARGQGDEAARLWQQVLALAPDQPDALHFMAQMAIRRGDSSAAFALLERAARGAPRDVVLHLNLAMAARGIGNDAAELTALDGALAADPACFPALLGKAEALERRGQPRMAAKLSKDALDITPPDDRLSPSLQQMAARARQRVASNAAALESFMHARLGNIPAAMLSPRADECLGIATGQKKAFVQQPTLLHFPALPPISFYDNADFPWLTELEAATDTVQGELMAVLDEDAAGFAPYVAHPQGVPLNQWAELNNSPKWNAWFLWRDGKPVAEHQARCPRTCALLARMPMAGVPDVAPSAFFSVLEPGAHIPAHTGVTNTRLIVHLPLIVPDNCRFRVGNDTRIVQRGKSWIFDDSIDHEAWNGSDKPRVILIFDIWNPHLTEGERQLVSALISGMTDYYSGA